MKKVFLIIVAFCLINTSRAGDLFDLTPDYGQFFAGGTDDAEKLIEAYMRPYANAFGASLSGGWYNTAKAHKKLGFDLTITANVGIVPLEDRTFDVSELGLEVLQVAAGEDPEAQTAAGERENGPQMQVDYELGGVEVTQDAFAMPKGTGMPFFISPMVQAGVGLVKDTEILGRYMPTVTSGNTELGLWGVGIKHGLKQWIPFVKRVPVLHLSLMVGYTQFNTKYNIEVTPDDIGADASYSGYSSSDWDNQYMAAQVTGLTGNLLASVNFPVVCIYGGVGFNTSKMTLDLKGDYPSYDIDNIQPTITSITDPFSIVVENTDGSATDPRLNLGMRFKFSVITLHADYTWADYSVVTAGLGISVR